MQAALVVAANLETIMTLWQFVTLTLGVAIILLGIANWYLRIAVDTLREQNKDLRRALDRIERERLQGIK